MVDNSTIIYKNNYGVVHLSICERYDCDMVTYDRHSMSYNGSRFDWMGICVRLYWNSQIGGGIGVVRKETKLTTHIKFTTPDAYKFDIFKKTWYMIIMKYIGLIIDPICYAPVLQCIGMDINEPMWYPVDNMLQPEEEIDE